MPSSYYSSNRRLNDGVDKSGWSAEKLAVEAVKDENAIAIHTTMELSEEAHAASLKAFEAAHPWQHVISIRKTYADA